MKRFATISEFHQFRQLPSPEHPLISVSQVEFAQQVQGKESLSWCYDFYCIGLKRVSLSPSVNFKYGQQPFDFNEGLLSFVAPNQLLSLSIDAKEQEEVKHAGWLLLIHPDFVWNTPLAKTIHKPDFWSYAVHESLFLSAKEEEVIIGIFQNIQREYQANIDQFSKQIIVSQVESLLNYSNRFYHRQFLTREKANHGILEKFEALLTSYFDSKDLSTKGLPTVQYVSGELNISPAYLRSLLKVLTGQSTQQHIHDKLIAKAKEKLSVTDLSISEIAYELGFEHPQSFTKLFKSKTNSSPLGYRQSFN